MTKNLRVLATFLVDGVAAGTWRVERAKRAARMVIESFEALPKRVMPALRDEGDALLRFVERDADTFEVRCK